MNVLLHGGLIFLAANRGNKSSYIFLILIYSVRYRVKVFIIISSSSEFLDVFCSGSSDHKVYFSLFVFLKLKAFFCYFKKTPQLKIIILTLNSFDSNHLNIF